MYITPEEIKRKAEFNAPKPELDYNSQVIQQLNRIERYSRNVSGWITFIGILIIIAVAVQLLDSCAAAF